MMFQEQIHIRRLYRGLMVVALAALTQDLSRGGGTQAWTYHYSTSPRRNWVTAREWCREHYTDMVAIQNQGEIAFLNQLLPRNPTYYWIGIRKVSGVWTWVGTNKTLSKEAENWAKGEPNNAHDEQDCVEIYIKRPKDTAQWNDESCFKGKGALCYTASCSERSCSSHAECVETIGNYTCQCHPGFQGPRCEEAVSCEAVDIVEPVHGSMDCVHSYGPFLFNSSCWFRCAPGYQVAGAPRLLCTAGGHWDHPAPLCRVKQCPVLSSASIGGGMNCSHPIAPHSYNSTCGFWCTEGYTLTGANQSQCDHTGQWTASVPTCTVVKCPPVSSPAMGNMTCVDPLEPSSFSSSCGFACEEGYSLTGRSTLTCLASGEWSSHTPMCTVVQCSALTAPPHASMDCQDGKFNYDSTCVMQCEKGFHLTGSNSTRCTSQGNWSHTLPICNARPCLQEVTQPEHGEMNCSHPYSPFSYSSHCDFSCNEGFWLRGAATMQCNTSGHWNQELPTCQARPCLQEVTQPEHGEMNCSHPYSPFSYSSHCDFSCNEGFWLRGAATMQCNTSGHWNQELPTCQARPCLQEVTQPEHGEMNCSHPYSPFSYSSHCDFSCNEGFWLRGAATMQCNTSGHWNQELPTCQARPCLQEVTQPEHGEMNCSHPYSPFSYSSHCEFSCNEGFWLRGAATMQCNTSGHWNQELPTCQVVRCETLPPPSSPLSMNCSHPLGNFSFGSQCLFTCGDGFLANGTQALSCSSNGSWSSIRPACAEVDMPFGAAMLMYAGVGAASGLAVLSLIGLGLLIAKRFNRKKGFLDLDDPAWEETNNLGFES